MDTEKLLTVLNTVLEAESSEVEPLLAELVDNVSQNNPDSLSRAEELRANIDSTLQDSPVNGLAPSYLNILSRVGGADFAGNGARVALRRVLDGGRLDVGSGLTTYLNNYRTFTNKARELTSTLGEMNVQAYQIEDYEVGFVVPAELNDMITLGERMKAWDRFIVICAQISGDTTPTAKVSRVSNGSVMIFVAQSLMVARIIEAVLRRLIKLYQEFQKIQKTQLEIEGLQLDNELKRKTLDDLRDAQLELEERCLKDAADEVFNEYYKRTSSGSGKAELRSQFNVALRALARDVQQGVEVEVTAPDSGEEEADDESSALNRSIAESNKKLKQIYSQPLESRLLPFEVKVGAHELRRLASHKPKKSSGKKTRKK